LLCQAGWPAEFKFLMPRSTIVREEDAAFKVDRAGAVDLTAGLRRL